MLPKGGDYIWGNATFAPDGVSLKGHMVSFAPRECQETIEDELLRAELEKTEASDEASRAPNIVHTDDGNVDNTTCGSTSGCRACSASSST